MQQKHSAMRSEDLSFEPEGGYSRSIVLYMLEEDFHPKDSTLHTVKKGANRSMCLSCRDLSLALWRWEAGAGGHWLEGVDAILAFASMNKSICRKLLLICFPQSSSIFNPFPTSLPRLETAPERLQEHVVASCSIVAAWKPIGSTPGMWRATQSPL